jgi:type 1 fimbriae regulatory protein FimB/type 1 fimbriae regulatory protein FimE
MNNIVRLATTNHPAPSTVNGRVPPLRRRNSEIRSREHLTLDEVERLMDAAGKTGRHRHRDRTMILIAFRHALRVSELVSLRWDQVDLKQGLLHVRRSKNGSPSTHPLRGPEIRALRRLQRDYPETPYVFVTERKGPLTTASVRKIITRAGMKAELGFPVHPHMLMPAASTWPTRDTTPGPFSTIWGIRTYSIRFDIPNWLLTGSTASGKTDQS